MKMTAKRALAVLLAVMVLFGCIGVGASAEGTTGFEAIRITCTMNGDAEAQRGFTWFTEKKCDSAIQVVSVADYNSTGFEKAITFEGTVSSWEGYYCHKALATGLKAGTEYVYRVGSYDRDLWSDVGTFVTDDGDDSFSFLAIADVQASSKENFEQAALVMDAAMELNGDAEFVVNLGDFVNDCTNEEWNWYGEAFNEANTSLTLVPVAGNH